MIVRCIPPKLPDIMPQLNMANQSKTTTRLSTKRVLYTVSGVALCAFLAVLTLYDRAGEGRMAGYEWRMPVVTDTTVFAGSGTLLNFPLLLTLRHDDLKTTAYGGKVRQEMGYDLRFSRADGATPLFHRIESYNPRAGEIEVWISLDTLHLGRPTLIYLYYGNASVDSMPTLQTAAHGIRGFMTGEDGPAPILDPDTKQVWMGLERVNQMRPGSMVMLGEPEDVAAPWPVTFDYLSARERAGSLVLVEFATSQEYDNDYFSIERSPQGMHYETLGRMGGGDHSEEMLRYTFTDPHPLEGSSYYRVKQVNNNGDFSYSDLIYLDFNPNMKGLEVQGVSPEIFNKSFSIQFSTDKPDHLTVTLYSASGAPLWVDEFDAGIGTHRQELSPPRDLEPGTYVLGVMGQDRKLKTFRLERM